MTLVVVLVDASVDVVMSSEMVARCSDLGVSSIDIAGDESTVALVFEGWALDSSRPEAIASIVGPAEHVRVLLPRMRVAVGAGLSR